MANNAQTVISPYGTIVRQENGLIYYYKSDDISIDSSVANELLKLLYTLDNSYAAKVIVVQGHRIEYSFEAQRLLLTSELFAKIAYVIETSTQFMTAELLQDLAKTFQSQAEIKLFQQVEEAEAWLLEG